MSAAVEQPTGAPSPEPTSPHQPPPLVRTAEAERGSDHPCGGVQAEAPDNVCVRAEGHHGPHVSQAGDGPHLQFEG